MGAAARRCGPGWPRHRQKAEPSADRGAASPAGDRRLGRGDVTTPFGEARERDRHVIRAGRHVEAEGSVRCCDYGARCRSRGHGHRGAWHRRAIFHHDASVERGRRRNAGYREPDQQDGGRSHPAIVQRGPRRAQRASPAHVARGTACALPVTSCAAGVPERSPRRAPASSRHTAVFVQGKLVARRSAHLICDAAQRSNR